MKKFIRPPENWQDFESLCKKLFGEMWECPLKIKRNGRQGQAQAGVDIFAIPKISEKYWGIQCKGKDNYSSSKLTNKEIDSEICKARKFKPELEVFIFCTTAVKDSTIEEYIRLKDIQSRDSGGFEILLYSWEDITDFIEENKYTYNWYLDLVKFKDQFDVQIDILGVAGELLVKPTFEKKITTFRIKNKMDILFEKKLRPLNNMFNTINQMNTFGSNKTNHSWCEFETKITNIGNTVLEDWKFYLYFDDNVRTIDDSFTKNIFEKSNQLRYRTSWVDSTEKSIKYIPLDNKTLIQKDIQQFKSYFIPNVGKNEICIHWKLLARDFNREGEIILKIDPKYIKTNKTKWVELKENEKREETIIEYIE